MALEIRSVVAGYTREVQILNGMSVSAADGKVTLLLGPNGAGKSTLLKTIYGYLSPEAGEILNDGKSLVGLKPKDMLREGIAYLIQGHSVFIRMTVEENLELGRSEEHTSELQSLMRNSYAVLCLKKKTITTELKR